MNYNIYQKMDELKELLTVRLNSNYKVKTTDQQGAVSYIDCNIFSDDQLETYLKLSLSNLELFLSIDTNSEDFFNDHMLDALIVQGAIIHAFSSQALIEAGREITLIDQGANFVSHTLSQMLLSQQEITLQDYNKKINLLVGNPNIEKLQKEITTV